MSGIDFNRPIRSVEIWHRNPKTDGYWNIVLNAETDDEAINRAVAMFEIMGFNPVVIDRIQVDELIPMTKKEGDGNAS